MAQVPKKTENGTSVGLVGSHRSAGSWDTKKSVQLKKIGDSVWFGDVDVPQG